VRWDEVERDLVILARDFSNVANSLTSLGAALRRERKNGTLRVSRGDAPADDKDSGLPAEQAMLFRPLDTREDPFE